MAGLLTPGPTRAKAEELRKQRGSRGLLEAIGGPMSYAPNPVVAMLGQGLLGAQYLTGEKELGEGLASLSDMTAMAVGSRLPPAMRKIFAGVNAATADKVKLARAQEMEKAGAGKRAIWKETGWFRGMDDKWRFEIDDSNSIPLAPNAAQLTGMKQGYPALLERQRALAHPNLSAAYPDSKKTGVLVSPTVSGGKFDPDRNMIESQGSMYYGGKANRSTMLHELQHYVQEKEGFDRGGSPESMQGMVDSRDALDRINKQLTDLNEQAGFGKWIAKNYKKGVPLNAQKEQFYKVEKPKFYQDWARLREQIDAIHKDWPELSIPGTQKGDANDLYLRLAGEAEARAVQSRMNMTSKQRGLLFPLDSYDVPLAQLIVR